jgi:ketol-acid reductoisomerase
MRGVTTGPAFSFLPGGVRIMVGYPTDLDLTGRTVVVVGLGAVGLRKASGLVDAGARVVLGLDWAR